MFWNVKELEWDVNGCKKDIKNSVDGQVTCLCNHLTDFSLIMGVVENNDNLRKVKEYLSNGLGIVSITCLIVTQILRHFVK